MGKFPLHDIMGDSLGPVIVYCVIIVVALLSRYTNLTATQPAWRRGLAWIRQCMKYER